MAGVSRERAPADTTRLEIDDDAVPPPHHCGGGQRDLCTALPSAPVQHLGTRACARRGRSTPRVQGEIHLRPRTPALKIESKKWGPDFALRDLEEVKVSAMRGINRVRPLASSLRAQLGHAITDPA